MRPSMIAVLLLASCGQTESPVAPEASDPLAAEPAQRDVQSSGEGAALVVAESPPPILTAVSPCLTQDGHAIPANNLRAVGTEPFWGAQVEGRCVTYSHPQDQAGTRVWTTFSGSAANGTWSGSLNGQPFVMRTRSQAGCSDGMSDNRYPIAVSLTAGGEQRSGCAEPR